MKKCIVTVVLLLLSTICINAFAVVTDDYVVDKNGEVLFRRTLDVTWSSCYKQDGTECEILFNRPEKNNDEYFNFFDSLEQETQTILLDEAKEYENAFIFELYTAEEDLYPEVLPYDVEIREASRLIIGGAGYSRIGKDYRLYFLKNHVLTEVEINDSDLEHVEFTAEQLGVYVLYFDPRVYDVTYYMDAFYLNDEDEDNVVLIEPEVYVRQEGYTCYQEAELPPIPQRDGYVFTGWKVPKHQLFFASAPPKATAGAYYVASWCPVEEYEPIEIRLHSDNSIIKGKEDGNRITLTTNYGVFENDREFMDLSNWHIVGTNDIAIGKVEWLNENTVELMLTGNTSELYKNTEIWIEFYCDILKPKMEWVELEDGMIVQVGEHTKIKMDEDGVMAEWYRSDNAITLERQKPVNSGSSGGGSTANYTVTFADGESKETVKVKQNAKVSEPEVPEKEGYVFGGWYLDEKCTVAYDFSAKVTRNFTLYAKWDKAEESQIILTVGEKEAVVNGETQLNDVAPMIKGDRAYLPARFVAESLGADVLWDAEAKTVTIQKDETEIILTIGEKDAEINGETVTSDVEPFLENDRTYTPIRLIAEALGADVEWNGEMNKIIITK